MRLAGRPQARRDDGAAPPARAGQSARALGDGERARERPPDAPARSRRRACVGRAVAGDPARRRGLRYGDGRSCDRLRLRPAHHGLECRARGPRIDCHRGDGDAFAHRLDTVCHEERRSSIENHGVTCCAGLTLQHSPHDCRVLGRIPAKEFGERRLADAELRGMDVEGMDGPITALRDFGVTGRRDLVDTVRTVHNPGTSRAEQTQ